MQTPDPDTHTGWLAGIKLVIAWTGYWLGRFIENVDISDIVELSALVFTCLQIYVLWRDKIRKKS